MTLVIALAIFFDVVLVGVFLVLLFSSDSSSLVDRLTQLGTGAGAGGQAVVREKREPSRKKVERVLTDVSKLLPPSAREVTQFHRLMIRAGYRRPELVAVLRGTKVLVPLLFLGIVYFTGWYVYSPIPILLCAAVFGFLLPDMWLSWRVRHRQFRMVLALPDALDLLVICVEGGLGLDQSIARVADELEYTHPELSDEFHLINLEMRVGRSRLEALQELADRTGVDDVKALVGMLVQTDRFGTDLAQALRVHADSLRTKRRQRAEEMAAKTSVKMVPPLVFFVFPALFVVLLGPAVVIVLHQMLPQLSK
jgi:tight adherence protein C